MPELPEVEVLVRHLREPLRGRRIDAVEVLKPRAVAPGSPTEFQLRLQGCRFGALTRRAKFLVFEMCPGTSGASFPLVGHLGMTGRMYLAPASAPLAKHSAVVIRMGMDHFVYEDARGFGRLTLEASGLSRLGPEPLSPEFSPEILGAGFAGSRQPVKVRLLDQAVVAGIGNIYASETLHRAGINPRTASGRIKPADLRRLHDSIRLVLDSAVKTGAGLTLDFAGKGSRGGLFYYGGPAEDVRSSEERFYVYDREGKPCRKCSGVIRRIEQAGRSTFFCPSCQPRNR